MEALVEMYHSLAEATDDPNNMIRVLFLDYRKTFDQINHNSFLKKLVQLGLPYTPNAVVELLPHSHCVGANLTAP